MALLKEIIIGTRGSALALIQTDIVARALKAADPDCTVTVRVVETHGDTNQNPIPLDTIGKGWFTKEIEEELLKGAIDLAVHSLKDMTEEMPKGLMIGAYLAREDARDVLVAKRGETLRNLPKGAVVGTDSARRAIQMLALRPDVLVKSMRGNVPTRIEKLKNEPYDAAILAAAGLIRLGLEDTITYYFGFDEITPAPGQGVLAVQARTGDTALEKLLKRVNDKDTAMAAQIERSFTRVAGGGCKSPVGAYAVRAGKEWELIGMVASEDGAEVERGREQAPLVKSAELGEVLAKRLLARLKIHA